MFPMQKVTAPKQNTKETKKKFSISLKKIILLKNKKMTILKIKM